MSIAEDTADMPLSAILAILALIAIVVVIFVIVTNVDAVPDIWDSIKVFVDTLGAPGKIDVKEIV